jgi:hypothetical protein
MFGRDKRDAAAAAAAAAEAAEESRRGGRWFVRLLGLGAIIGAGALWKQRQEQRELDEELWGEPEER